MFREEDRINMALIEKEAHEAIAQGKAADLRRADWLVNKQRLSDFKTGT